MQNTQKLFSVYDTKAQAFRNLFTADSSGVAVRQFETIANDKTTDIACYPADFTLFEVGEFDMVSGQLHALDNPINLGMASALVREVGEKKG